MNKKVVHFKKLNRAEEKNSENEIFLLGQDYVNDNEQNFLAPFLFCFCFCFCFLFFFFCLFYFYPVRIKQYQVIEIVITGSFVPRVWYAFVLFFFYFDKTT